MNHLFNLSIGHGRLVVLKDVWDVVGVSIRRWLAGYEQMMWVWLMLELAKEDGLHFYDLCMVITHCLERSTDQTMQRRSCDGKLLEHIQNESCEVDQLITVGGELIDK